MYDYMYIQYMLLRDAEGRKKEASKVKQTTRQSNVCVCTCGHRFLRSVCMCVCVCVVMVMVMVYCAGHSGGSGGGWSHAGG